VLNGNTSDRGTWRGFLKKIEDSYGQAQRVWVMDRGIASEAILAEMRDPERQTFDLAGPPEGRIHQHEKKWLEVPWPKVRDSVEVKRYQHEGELYVLGKREGRPAKINMRRQRLARLRVCEDPDSPGGPARPWRDILLGGRRNGRPLSNATGMICCAAISPGKIRRCGGRAMSN